MSGNVGAGTKRLNELGLSAREGRNPALSGITADSRAVTPGTLFAALPGTLRHGADFIATALDAGASAILTDPMGAIIASERLGLSDAALIVADDPREALAYASAPNAMSFPVLVRPLLAVTAAGAFTHVGAAAPLDCKI